MYITKIDDPDYCRSMKRKLKANNGFCPDAPEHTEEFKCPCKAFREQGHDGYCDCAYLYMHMSDE